MRVCREWRRSTQPGRSDRTGRTTAKRSARRRIVARRRDEPVQSDEAPEVAAEFDRPGVASRPEAEIQRPVAPGAEVAKPKRLLWIAAAVVLGIVLAVAGRGNPDASEAAGPRHQASGRDAATRPAGTVCEDR